MSSLINGDGAYTNSELFIDATELLDTVTLSQKLQLFVPHRLLQLSDLRVRSQPSLELSRILFCRLRGATGSVNSSRRFPNRSAARYPQVQISVNLLLTII
jgi:hypothetical protein